MDADEDGVGREQVDFGEIEGFDEVLDVRDP